MELRQIDEDDKEENQATIFDKAKFAASLAWFRALHNWNKADYPWWASVVDDVAIGGIPMRNCGHVEDLLAWAQKKSPKTGTGRTLAVLSLICAHEEGSIPIVGAPMQEKDFLERKIERTVVPARDWRGLSRDQFKEALKILKQNKVDGKATLVHCKAGLGRSPSVVIAHLVMQDEMNMSIGNLNSATTREQASEVFKTYHDRLKKQWPNIKMNDGQCNATVDFMFHLCGDKQGRDWLNEYKSRSREVAKK